MTTSWVRRSLRRLPLALVPVVTAVPLLVGGSGGTGGEARRAGVALAGRSVEAIYLSDCATCHGAEGEGTNRGPSLEGVGTASLDYYLSTGRMPLPAPDAETVRRDPAYPPAQIDELVDYVDELTGGRGPDVPEVGEGDVAEGGALYRLQCAACHSWSGTGGALLDREAPDVRPATPTQTAEAIRIGPGTMPTFAESALDDEQLAAVVAYTDYLDDPRDRGGAPLWHLGPLPEGAVAIVVGLGALLLAVRWIGTRA